MNNQDVFGPYWLCKSEPKKQFASQAELIEFLSTEIHYWSNFFTENERKIYDGSTQEIINKIIQWHITPLQNASQHQTKPQFDSFFAIYRENKLLYSKSPTAKYLEKLKTQSVRRAASFLFSFIYPSMMHQINPSQWSTFIALAEIERHIYDIGNKAVFSTAHEDFENLKIEANVLIQRKSEQLERLLESSKQLVLSTKDELNTFQVANKTKLENFETLSTKTINSLNQKAETQRNEFNEEYQNTKKFYKDDLKLQAPVTYWTKVASDLRIDRDNKKSSFIRSCIGFVEIFVLSILITHEYGVFNESNPYWLIPISLMYASLGIWLLRIEVREYFSLLHRQADAEARITMVQTYLALLSDTEDDHLRKHADIVLRSLFRTSPLGIIKGDAMPIFDIISAAKKEGT